MGAAVGVYVTHITRRVQGADNDGAKKTQIRGKSG
jgi:hypothetical protein